MCSVLVRSHHNEGTAGTIDTAHLEDVPPAPACALLLALPALFFKFLVHRPDFPFWGMLARALGRVWALALYYMIIRVLGLRAAVAQREPSGVSYGRARGGGTEMAPPLIHRYLPIPRATQSLGQATSGYSRSRRGNITHRLDCTSAASYLGTAINSQTSSLNGAVRAS